MPVVTTLAIEEPETMPVKPLANTAALAGPPLKEPSRLKARRTKYSPPPARSIMAPNSTNKNTMLAETSRGMP